MSVDDLNSPNAASSSLVRILGATTFGMLMSKSFGLVVAEYSKIKQYEPYSSHSIRQRKSVDTIGGGDNVIGCLCHKRLSLFHTGLKVNRARSNAKAGAPALLLEQGQGAARIAAAAQGNGRGALGSARHLTYKF